jgi:hypothetical protein
MCCVLPACRQTGFRTQHVCVPGGLQRPWGGRCGQGNATSPEGTPHFRKSYWTNSTAFTAPETCDGPSPLLLPINTGSQHDAVAVTFALQKVPQCTTQHHQLITPHLCCSCRHQLAPTHPLCHSMLSCKTASVKTLKLLLQLRRVTPASSLTPAAA